MEKSTKAGFLDYVRYLLIICGTVAVLFFFGARVHWLLPIISAIPAFLVIFCLVDFLTLPFYLLTPEHRAMSTAMEAIEKYDFDTALGTLEAFEKSKKRISHDSRQASPVEMDVPQNEFVRVQDGDSAGDDVRDLVTHCDELIDSIDEIIHDDSLNPEEKERLLNNNETELETYKLMLSNKNTQN